MIQYGILEEKSDYRIHVCPLDKKIYIFKTSIVRDMVKDAIQTKKYRFVPARCEGELSGWGYIIPPTDILGIRFAEIKPTELTTKTTKTTRATSEDGDRAVALTIEAIKNDELPYITCITEPIVVTEKKKQIDGVDIIVTDVFEGILDLQVKWDGPGGICGTGNLYIQTHEVNLKNAH